MAGLTGLLTDIRNSFASGASNQSHVHGDSSANYGSLNNSNNTTNIGHYHDGGNVSGPAKSTEDSTSRDLSASCLFDLVQFLFEADSYAVLKEVALKKEAKALRERLEDSIGNMDLDQFRATLSVADQTAHRPKVKPRDLDHPRFYWIFKDMDYDQWFAQDSEVLLLSGPTNCALDEVSSHILGLMEEGRFGKNLILLSFFSPDGATRGNRPITRRDSETTGTIFVHTLLSQLISSESVSGKNRISTACEFLTYLLDSIDSPELLVRFKNISGSDTLAII
jgi:hypothetical protein